MTETLISLLILIVLLALDLSAVAARCAFASTSHSRLLALREHAEARVSQASAILARQPRARASLNFVILLSRFALAGWVLYFVPTQMGLTTWWAQLISLFLASLVLFLIEWGIESSVRRDPETAALRFTPFVRACMAVLAPLIALPLAATKDSQSELEASRANTEAELKTMVDAGQEEGVIEQDEREMIYSVIELRNTLAREIMVPRIDMLALEVNTPLLDAVDALLTSGHSRVPVYEETVDHLLGLLYAKDLLRVWRDAVRSGEQTPAYQISQAGLDSVDHSRSSLGSLLRPAYFIPEAKRVDELLSEMQSQRIHMAIVVDEYGGVAGMVTLEDIAEEILGEIRDEFDQAEELPYQVLKNGDHIFLGRVDLDDFNQVMGSQLDESEADTLGGFVYSRLGRVPIVGETVKTGDLLLAVEQVSDRRILKVRARWLESDKETKEEGNNADR